MNENEKNELANLQQQLEQAQVPRPTGTTAPCGHSTYWQTVYNNCMACRAEHAEAQLAAAEARIVELTPHTSGRGDG